MSEDSERDEDQRILESLAGDRDGVDAKELVDLVYAELRNLAEHILAQERRDHTLQPTALVHEAWIRLAGDARFADRKHFFASAARAMRNVLVDHARGKRRVKRGAEWQRVEIDPEVSPPGHDFIDLIALDQALETLKERSERQCLIVEMRFFAGFTVPEVAQLIQVSEETVARDWRFARAWLARQLKAEDSL